VEKVQAQNTKHPSTMALCAQVRYRMAKYDKYVVRDEEYEVTRTWQETNKGTAY
jgi:ATP-dependent phosphoenolpyruvate carboxykinase